MDRIVIKKPYVAMQCYTFDMSEYINWVENVLDYNEILEDFECYNSLNEVEKMQAFDSLAGSIENQLKSYSTNDVAFALDYGDLIVRLGEEELDLGDELNMYVDRLVWDYGDSDYYESYGSNIIEVY